MLMPGTHIETLWNPGRYTPRQIDQAAAIAELMNRGKLVLAEEPALRPPAPGETGRSGHDGT